MTISHSPRSLRDRTRREDRHLKFYELRDNLTVDDLDALAAQVRPGSCVSFYFDERFTFGRLDDSARTSLLAIAERDGSAVIGAARVDEIEIEIDFPSSKNEVDEFVTDHPDATLVFGAFPGRDDDGHRAVTLTLPDADGLVRLHPY